MAGVLSMIVPSKSVNTALNEYTLLIVPAASSVPIEPILLRSDRPLSICDSRFAR